MDNQDIKAAIRHNRSFMKSDFQSFDIKTDQQLQLPQPPLVKPPSGAPVVTLPKEFEAAVTHPDYLELLHARRSHRVYGETPLSLLQLSFLLWSTQGIREIRGNNYATMRPVPSGGARHAFETYLAVLRVEGLERGIYRYLPMEHALERVSAAPDSFESQISASLCDQEWAVKSGAVFYYSVTPYRAEWRYSALAHRVVLIDAGHVVQNLYLSCTAAGCGTCAIAAFDQKVCDDMLGIDGEEEFTVYAAPVGTL